MGKCKLVTSECSIYSVYIIFILFNSIINMSASLRRVIISTKKAPDAIGPYNQAVQVNSTLYISGQIGFNPSTMEIVSGGVVAEAKQALTNMGHILDAANCNFNNVVKTTVLLADINDFAAVNEVYTKFFTANYPARAD